MEELSYLLDVAKMNLQHGENQPVNPVQDNLDSLLKQPTSLIQPAPLVQQDDQRLSVETHSERQIARETAAPFVDAQEDLDSLLIQPDPLNQSQELEKIYMNSPYLKSTASFERIFKAWQAEGSPDIGNWLIDEFPEIEAELIRQDNYMGLYEELRDQGQRRQVNTTGGQY